MATQTVHFGAGSGVTAAKLYSPGSDTVVATGATPSQASNSKRWSSAFTDVTAGTYVLVATNSSGVVVADWRVKLAATTGDYHAYEYAGADAEQSGGGTDGSYAITVSVEAASVGVAGAKVEVLTDAGASIGNTKYTGTLGTTVFNLDAGDYIVRVTPPNTYTTPDDYDLTVADSDTVTIALTAAGGGSVPGGWGSPG